MERGVPLIKTLSIGGGGEYQFKHLSLQEKLFIKGIKNGEVTDFWPTDTVLIKRLNDAFYRNTFTVGKGHLGEALAQQRPVWNLRNATLKVDSNMHAVESLRGVWSAKSAARGTATVYRARLCVWRGLPRQKQGQVRQKLSSRADRLVYYRPLDNKC